MRVQRHQNYEAVNDEEFFEFQEVESHYNNVCNTEDENSSGNPKATPTGVTGSGSGGASEENP